MPGTAPSAGTATPDVGRAKPRPAETYLDGTTTERFYAVGPHAQGIPVVPIYRGDDAGVRAGAFLWIDEDVELQPGGNHRTDWVSTFPLREIFDLPGAYDELPWSKGEIVIGNGVVLGRGSRVLSGVRIGDGAMVAPYSVVTKDVRSYTVAAGHPAQELGPRFSAGVVASLETVPWWTWPDSLVQGELAQLAGPEALDLVRQLSGAPRLSMSPRADLTKRARGLVARALTALARRVRADTLPPIPPVVVMGTGSYWPPSVHGSIEDLTVGSYSSIADDTAVLVCDDRSPISDVVAQNLDSVQAGSRRVDIGNDVWIGRGTRILSGVTIGDGAVVGAFSVVRGDVRPYAISVGNPAREVRRRFDDATVDALLRIRWWDWPHERVLEKCEELCSAAVRVFVDEYDTAPET